MCDVRRCRCRRLAQLQPPACSRALETGGTGETRDERARETVRSWSAGERAHAERAREGEGEAGAGA